MDYSKRKTVICRYFASGKLCPYGYKDISKCNYAHGVDDLCLSSFFPPSCPPNTPENSPREKVKPTYAKVVADSIDSPLIPLEGYISKNCDINTYKEFLDMVQSIESTQNEIEAEQAEEELLSILDEQNEERELLDLATEMDYAQGWNIYNNRTA